MNDNSSNAAFPVTRWSIVARLEIGDRIGRGALEELCRIYRAPIYSFARHSGQSPADAEDLVQGFLFKASTSGLFHKADEERGKLRTFLLTAFRRFMRDEYDKSHAQKRGAGNTVSVDMTELEGWYTKEEASLSSPECAFDRRWALSILENTISTLAGRWEEKGKREEFDVLRPFLTDSGQNDTYAEIGKQFGSSADSVKVKIHRLRASFSSLLRDEVALTIQTDEDVDDELRYLIELI